MRLVYALIAPAFADHGAPGLRGEDPLVQCRAPNANRVLQILIETGTEPVVGD
jgi:hypothetical protein